MPSFYIRTLLSKVDAQYLATGEIRPRTKFRDEFRKKVYNPMLHQDIWGDDYDFVLLH